MLRLHQLGAAAWVTLHGSLHRQIITNNKLLFCYFGFPIILLSQRFEVGVRKSIPDPVLIMDEYRDTPKQMF